VAACRPSRFRGWLQGKGQRPLTMSPVAEVVVSTDSEVAVEPVDGADADLDEAESEHEDASDKDQRTQVHRRPPRE
jgi:hypothetical protein